MARTLRGEVRPVVATAFPPMAVGIERQATAEPHWHRPLTVAEAHRRFPGVLSNSLLHGFPYADVPEMGAAVVAVADGDRHLAQGMADELAR